MTDLLSAIVLPAETDLWATVLVDASVKGAAVLLLAGLLSLVLRRASAATRHLIWSLAVASVLVLPALSLVLPAWRLPILPAGRAGPQTAPVDVPAVAAAPDPVLPAAEMPLPGAAAPVASEAVSVRRTANAAGEQSTAGRDRPWHASPWRWLLLVWGAGALAVLSVLLVGTVGVLRIVRDARPVEPGSPWSAVLVAFDPSTLLGTGKVNCSGHPERSRRVEFARKLGLPSRVRLLVSSRVAVPMAWGFARPVVLLPAEGGAWSEERRRVVILHELAHVRRRDCVTQALAQVACALYWFNPLVWLAGRRMRVERERACDDHVLRAGLRPSGYADHLLQIARSARPARCAAIAAVAMARPSQLEGRLLAILDATRSRQALTRLTVALALIAMTCLLLPIAALKLGEAVAEEPETAPVGTPGAKATLPGRVTVELVGVSYNPSRGQPWWQPDGSPLAQAPYDSMGRRAHAEEDVQAYEFAVRIANPPADRCATKWLIVPTVASAGGDPRKNGQAVPNLWANAASIPRSHDTCTVAFGLASGPWQQLTSFNGIGGPKAAAHRLLGDVVFSPASELDGNVRVNVAHAIEDKDYRVIALDREAQIHHPELSSAAAGEAGLRLMVATFKGLPLFEVKEFQFQVRPYEWVEFRNVSLEPSHRTQVEVVTEPSEVRRYVRLVVGKDRMTFEGQQTTWEELPTLLEKVTDRAHTAFECAVASDDLTLEEQNRAQGLAARLVRQFGFNHLTYIGQHPLGTRGTGAPEVEAPEVEIPVTQALSFGPVIERVVKGAETGSAIDLDTGLLFSAPGLEREAEFALVRKNGIDAVGETDRASPGLGALDMSVFLLGNDYWDKPAGQVPFDQLPETQTEGPALIPAQGELPVTYMFRTREGGTGILQIVEVQTSEKPEYIRIRYKMVQASSADKGSNSRALTEDVLAVGRGIDRTAGNMRVSEGTNRVITGPGSKVYQLQWRRGGKTKADKPPFLQNQVLETTAIATKKLRGIPGFDARYASLRFDDAGHTALVCGICRSSGELPEGIYDVFFVDLDDDSRIEEKEILRGELDSAGEGFHDCDFGSVDILLQGTGERRPYTVFLSRRSSYAHGELYVQSHCYMSGPVDLGDGEMNANLVDNNCDGRFDTMSRSRTRCDFVWLDRNGDGELQWNEQCYVGGFAQYKGQLLHVSASADGKQLVLAPYQEKLGRLKVPHEDAHIGLRDPRAPLRLSLEGAVISVPAATYDVDGYSVDFVGQDGEPWRLIGGSGWYDEPWKTGVEVHPGKTVELSLGPPFGGKIEAKANLSAGYVAFSWEVIGQGGEQVSLSSPQRMRPLPPRIEIRDANDAVVHSASMEGGCGGAAVYKWYLGADVPPGRYRASAVCNSWPVDVSPAECSLELGEFLGEIRGQEAAPALSATERESLNALISLSQAMELKYPSERRRWNNLVLYHVSSEAYTVEWEMSALGAKAGGSESEVGYGSSRLADAQAHYYLQNGTPLRSRWQPRGNGMSDIWIDIGRPLKENERVQLVSCRSFDAENLLIAQDGPERVLRFYTRKQVPRGIIVRLDRPLDLLSSSLRGAEVERTRACTWLTWLLPPSSEEAVHLVTYAAVHAE